MENCKENILKDYVIEKKIGQGAFGEVFRATKGGKKYAIKSVAVKKLTPKIHKYLQRETEIQQMLCHKNVVRCYETLADKAHHYFILEYCNGGNLAEYRKRNGGRLPEIEVRSFLRQMGEGLNALYELGAIHRDLKLSNFLLQFESEEAPPVLKLADFGFSRLMEMDALPIDSDIPFEMSIVGTPANMAPELLLAKQPVESKTASYNIKADIWSFGTVAFELLFGHPPFVGMSRLEFLKNVELGIFTISKRIPISLQALSFLLSCLQYDSSKRICWTSLRSHDFLNSTSPTHTLPLSAFIELNNRVAVRVAEKEYFIMLSTKCQYSFEGLHLEESKPSEIPPLPEEKKEIVSEVEIKEFERSIAASFIKVAGYNDSEFQEDSDFVVIPHEFLLK